MPEKASILIVEDELAIRTGLVDVLVYHGYDVDFADEGKQALEKALHGQFDLILLDVMLPGMNGFDICAAIREQDKEQAIIMLTAKTADEDVIQGLSLGADDYIAKPFSVAQLVLRIKAVLRRMRSAHHKESTIKLSDERIIDRDNLWMTFRKTKTAFTRREMQVIDYLYENKQRPVSREELLEKVWGYGAGIEIETRTVDIHIAKIRKKIEYNAKSPCYLRTVRGAGYRLHVEQ